MKPLSGLRISLFGKLKVLCGEQILTGLDLQKVQELFCYLLLHRDRPHPRENLASLLWGDTTTVQSKRYLRKALWQLQTALACQAESENSRVLLVRPEWVQFHPEANYWLDVATFEQAFTLAQDLSGRELDSQHVLALQNAVKLYKGELLEGWYQDWCLYERERFQHMYLSMLDKLMDFCEAHHQYESGIVYGARILRYDRARERTHRRLMRLHYLSNDRTIALRQFQRCVTALDEELGVKPAKRTLMLYNQIRSDQLDGSLLGLAGADTPSGAATLLLPGVLSRLKSLQQILAETQRQVRQEIEAIERVSNTPL